MTVDHEKWAEFLLAGFDERRELQAITKQIDELTLEDAYEIQSALLNLHLARGDAIAGPKLGLTSVAKQEQMGVDEPCYGWILESSMLDETGEVVLDQLIHPRCEPEIVFVLAEDLAGPNVTANDVFDATKSIVGGIEVIDSRYEKFSFTLADVVADNTSASRMAVGSEGVGPRDVDLVTLGCVFEIDGAITATATAAALLGDPAACVAMLANHLGKNGQKLQAGWVVPAGAPVDAQPLGVGTVATARYSALGSVTVKGV